MADLLRIKNNVRKMVDQNAPESDIDQYIASEGVSLDDVRNFQPSSTAGDMAKSLGVGAAKGTIGIAGLGGDLESFVKPYLPSNETINNAVTSMGFDPNGTVGNIARGALSADGAQLPTSSDIQGKIEDNVTGKFYTPQTTAGKYSETVGEFLPSLFGGEAAGAVKAGESGAKILLKALGKDVAKDVLAPAVTSEAAGQATEGTALEPYARFAGAIAGHQIPGAIERGITPLPASDALKAQTGALADAGVSLTAGQKTGNKLLKALESELGGSEFYTPTKESFTSAALQKIGVTADRATPEVMDQALTNIGQKFNDLASKYDMPVDPSLKSDLQDVLKNYQNDTGPSMQAAIIKNTVKDINGKKIMTGDAYKELRSELSAKASKASGEQRDALQGIMSSLDDAMERNIAAVNPDDVGAWQSARKDYRNYLVLEKAVAGSGAETAKGLISPQALRNATTQVQGARNYVRGQGDFADLARAGEATLRDLPDSGTAVRAGARGAATDLMAALGGGGGAALLTGHPATAALGLLALAPRAATTKIGQAYLGNQLLNAGKGFSARQELINAMLAGQSANDH
jgi:hypothetical protein